MATDFPLFGRLPIELKTHILRQRLVLPIPITTRSHPSHSRRTLLPLALTCKQLHTLAHQVYYEENTFVASSDLVNWRYPNPAFGAQVRKLQIRIIVEGNQSVVEENKNFPLWRQRPFNEWRYLLDMNFYGQPSHDCISWQQHFTRLNSLEIIVVICDMKGFPAAWEHEAIEVLGSYHTRLEAKRVEVVIEGIKSCLDHVSDNEVRLPGGECCKERIASVIRGKIGIRK